MMKYMNRTTALFLTVVFLNALYSNTLPLHYDEAYYWQWSKHLALSYFDHPPMIAWLLWLAGHFGESVFVLRLVPLFCMTVSGMAVWRLTHEAFGQAAADTLLLLYTFLPIVHIGFLLATPDAPLALFWTLSLYAAWRAVFPRTGDGKAWGWWLAAGILFGCALLSKYTAVLLFPSLVLAVAFSRKRALLFSGRMLAAILAATAVFLPVLWWNWQNSWVSFLFQFKHGIAEEKVFNATYFWEFIGGQAGVLSPLVFLGLLYALFRFLSDNLYDDKLSFFFWPCVFPLIFFCHAAMFKRAAANWPIPAYASGLALLSWWAASRDWRRWKIVSLTFSIFIVLLLKAPGLFPFLPAKAVLTNQFKGEPQIFAKLHLPPGVAFLGDNYGPASLAAYYLPQPSPVWVLSAPRVSMYNYWQQGKELPKEGFYVGRYDEKDDLSRYYAKVERQEDILYQEGGVNRRFFVYKTAQPLEAVFK